MFVYTEHSFHPFEVKFTSIINVQCLQFHCTRVSHMRLDHLRRISSYSDPSQFHSPFYYLITFQLACFQWYSGFQPSSEVTLPCEICMSPHIESRAWIHGLARQSCVFCWFFLVLSLSLMLSISLAFSCDTTIDDLLRFFLPTNTLSLSYIQALCA